MKDYQDIEKMIAEEREKGAFIFMPSPILSMEDSFYMPMVETVFLRDDEVYKATGKYRIHYNGLLRLSAAAAFEWSAIDTCRTDGRTDRFYCSFRAVGGVMKADGRVYFHKAESDIDLEVIEDELTEQYSRNWDKIPDDPKQQWKRDGHKAKDTFVNAMVKRDLIQKRKNKLTLCESGAKARVIRFVLGLQGQYSNKHDVIGMPFILVHYALNIKHPAVKKQLTAGFAQSQTMIYGGVKDTGQIAYHEPDYNDSNVIDIPSQEEPEENAEFEPAEKQPLDFENCSIDDQIKTLKTMCKSADEDYKHYEKTTKENGGVAGMDQEWRNKFFNYLSGKTGGGKK
jgi:hypothetical protein